MNRVMLKSKIHGARITGLALHYEGSITLDTDLLDAADLLAGEQVHVLNLHTGSRLVTYTIPAPRGSGTVLLNGPAARLGEVGDPVIVLSYGAYPTKQARAVRPRVVLVDRQNRPCRPATSKPTKRKVLAR